MLRRLYTECKLNYLTQAGRYQLLDFSQKVAFVWDARCALAHEQFWIERRVRSEDPLFACFNDFLQLIDEAKALLLPEDADLPQVWAKINEARAAVGKVIGAVDELARAVDLMAQAPSKDRDSAEDENELRSREFMANDLRAEAFWMRMEDWVADAGTAMMAALHYGRNLE